MSTRVPSHQLSNGLYVSGTRPDPPKERQPTMSSRAIPYTGGDVRRSGELGKMFDIQVFEPGTPLPPTKPTRLPYGSKKPGQAVKTPSGPQLPTTGLITSDPPGSGRVVPEGSGSKAVYGSAVTTLTDEVKLGFMVSTSKMWMFFVAVVVMGLVTFVVAWLCMVEVKKDLVLLVMVAEIALAALGMVWNFAWKKTGFLGFWNRFPDTELRRAVDGQFVKVTGVVTCGRIPLESSFQRVPRCVLTSTELSEYRGWGGKPANHNHRFFSWGCGRIEKHATDFYISDLHSGLRVLVRAGHGAKVAPFVKTKTVADVTKSNNVLSPDFVRWLTDHCLSRDDRVMRLKEGYIKEGSTVSVMGVVRRNDNVQMIVPPTEPTSTGYQWTFCLLPTYVEGLILICNESQDDVVISV